ncbi:MAG: hypothetical protein QM711_06255 [Micropruina sp.]|uniref:hypothetical protein n=1 Tax=Micropruina sp. TaxID=2737536 RepID=UPI0039E47AFE
MSAQRDLGQSMLQVIFSFFLGLAVVAFIGIGVNTFYPEPGYTTDSEGVWNSYRLTTSIVLLVCATLVMLLSLAIANTGSVLANGALLGGLFTMLYAVGIGISAGQQWPRFLVMAAALVITVGVGWWKFSRRRPGATATAAGAWAPPGAGVLSGEAEERLAAVEAKLDALGRALRD